MAVRHKQLRVIERRALLPDAGLLSQVPSRAPWTKETPITRHSAALIA